MLKIIGSLIFINILVFARIDATLSKQNITLGESVHFTITTESENTEFPEIENINGFNIESTSNSNSISIINGQKSIKISKTYLFTPTKSIVIPSFDIKVNDKVEKTPMLNLNVSKQAIQDANFLLEIKADKRKAFVGEAINLTVLFKRKADKQIVDLVFDIKNFPDFWSKQADKEQTYKEDEFIVHQLEYILFPQKDGNISINPLRIKVATAVRGRDMFGFPTKVPKWQSVFSNEMAFNIEKLPNNLKLIGDFKLEASVDKTAIKENEAVNLTLKISGSGNLDDLEKFKLDIENSTIYDDKAEKIFKVNNEKYEGEYIQKFAIISDKDFKIPSFSLNYLDQKSKTEKIISSEEIFIKVDKETKEVAKLEKSLPKKDTEVIQKDEVTKTTTEESNTKETENSSLEKFLYLLVGLIIGIISVNYKRVPLNLSRVNFVQNDRDLLKLLMLLSSKSVRAGEILKDLEANIYQGENNKIDKKEIKKLLDNIKD